jgi:antitoxin ParD1/3/4
MNVSLGLEWEQFVNKEVESGRYDNASEVLREALRLLEEREKALQRITFNSQEELEELLAEGVRELDANKGIPGDVAFQILRDRAAVRRGVLETAEGVV